MIKQPGVAELVPRKKETGGVSNAIKANLLNVRYDAVVLGLWGCTSVIVVSEKGVWLSHFFEMESFNSDDDTFIKDVLDAIGIGDGTDLMPGLGHDTGPGGLFAADTNPKALIVTPQDPDGTPSYTDKIKRIQEKLNSVIPGLKQLNNQGGVADVVTYLALRIDPSLSQSKRVPTGKILFQYDPRQIAVVDDLDTVAGCPVAPIAMARVWVEDQKDTPVLEMAWTAKDNQRSGAKRDLLSGASCSRSLLSSQKPSITTSSAISQTTTSTSNPALSTARGSIFCVPTSGPGSVPIGIPKNQFTSNITDFCAAVERTSQALVGCDNKHHDGILLSTDCNGAGNAFGGPFTTDGMNYNYPGVIAWLNVSLVHGSSFIVNQTICNTALSAVLNHCPPFLGSSFLLPPNKFGGGMTVSDGIGGVANFNMTLQSVPGNGGTPGCAYVIATDLRSKALCAADYCNCGGTVAPLLTSTVSGSTTLNCAYSTQPATATCPPAPSSNPTKTTATVATSPTPSTSSTAKCIPCMNASATTEQDAGCPLDRPDWFSINGLCSCCYPI